MEKRLFTSESVTEGHPDKICDAISDAILDALMEKDPMSRVACETAITTGMVLVMGEITTNAYIDMQQVVRETIKEIGYDNGDYGFDAHTLIITELDRLGRNKQEILKQLRFLEEKGVRVMGLELPTTLFDLSQMENNLAKMMIETINNMMIELYASMAQAEMEKKEKRQKEGMEAKRLRGEWDEVGRPRAIEQEKFNQEFMRVVQKKVTPTQLQRELGLTSSTYYRYRKNFYENFPEFLQSV